MTRFLIEPEHWTTPLLSDERLEWLANMYIDLQLFTKGVCFIAFCHSPVFQLKRFGRRRLDYNYTDSTIITARQNKLNDYPEY